MNYVQSIILENENIHIFSKLKKVLQLKCNKDKICIKLLAKKKLGTTETRSGSLSEPQTVPINVLEIRYEEAELLLRKNKDENGMYNFMLY